MIGQAEDHPPAGGTEELPAFNSVRTCPKCGAGGLNGGMVKYESVEVRAIGQVCEWLRLVCVWCGYRGVCTKTKDFDDT